MPSRVIKESITTSETLACVSAEAERCFWRLVVLADDYGRYEARPVIILGKGFASMLGAVRARDVDRWLNELESVRLIDRYTVEGKEYLRITNWDRHQQTRAKTSKYPSPTSTDRVPSQPLADDNGCNQVLADASKCLVSGSVSVSDNGYTGSGANALDPRVLEVFRYYQERIQPAARLIDAARNRIRTRLKTFTPDELKRAVDNMAADSWWMETNGRRGAAWFFDSDKRAEMLLNLVPNAGRAANGQRGQPITQDSGHYETYVAPPRKRVTE